MILNAFGVLDGFVTILRLVVALLVTGLAISAWLGWRRAAPQARGALEDRSYLLSLLGLLLLFLNLASWPLLYLLLDSYVPEWPGVMCIYGVTQVGAGSHGMSRFLPGLLRALQLMKPALIFGGGAWAMLYLANRRTSTSPLMGRVLLALLGLGLLALLDSSLEAAYLMIPKQEEFLASGCCTDAFEDNGRFLPSAIVEDDQRSWLRLTYYAINGGMILGLFIYIRRLSFRPSVPGLGLLLAGSAIALLVNSVYLIDIVAPALLRLPHHHCPYDLIPKAPESVLGVASFVFGTFAVGWACVAAWFASCPETQTSLKEQVRIVLVVGLFGYLGSVVLLGLELALN